MSLRKEIIRLAHAKPELRKHLLPLVKEKTAFGRISELERLIAWIYHWCKRDGGECSRTFSKDLQETMAWMGGNDDMLPPSEFVRKNLKELLKIGPSFLSAYPNKRHPPYGMTLREYEQIIRTLRD